MPSNRVCPKRIETLIFSKARSVRMSALMAVLPLFDAKRAHRLLQQNKMV